MCKSCILDAIDYEQAVHRSLASVVEKLCYHAVAQMAAFEYMERYEFAVIGVIVLNLYARQFGKTHNQRYYNKNNSKYGVCELEVVDLGIRKGVCCRIVYKYQLAQEHGGNESAQSVESLCQIKTARCCGGITQFCHVGICCGLQETHAYGHYKEGAQVERETVE